MCHQGKGPRGIVAGVVLLGLVLLSRAAPTSRAASFYQSPGTQKMAARLVQIRGAQDWKTDPYKNGERAAYLRRLLAARPDASTEVKARLALGDALLMAGYSAAAVEELEQVRRIGHEEGTSFDRKFAIDLRDLLATAYLRTGEQENCVAHHALESCLFPIRGSGIHRIERGSRGAIRELTAMLDENPHDLNARWLLNIAYMTLGQHPQQVPKGLLIPASLFDSEYDVGRFPDAAPALGLNVTGHAGGAIVEDFDEDGFLDVMVSSSGPSDQLRFFHSDGDGRFTERTMEAGLAGETGGLNLVHADYNNDGHPDVVILRGGWLGVHGNYPNSLVRNNGNGTFDDVTEEAGLLSFHPTQTGAWADYDNDGWLDLYIGNESSIVESHPSQLYHNNRDGTLTNVAAACGLADMGYVKGVAWGDYNNDGWPDLYVSRKGSPNRLFRNEGKPAPGGWSFTDVTKRAGVGEPLYSFATWFWDYDNDGWEDLLVTGYYTEANADIGAFHLDLPNKAEVHRLYHNDHDGTFSDVTRKVKLNRVILAMGANFGDLDNDGFLDCYFGTGAPDYQALLPNRMFRNEGGRRFQDVTTSGGFGHLQKGHGIAFADVDNDGDQDVFIEIGGAYEGDTYQSALFENPGHGNHWVDLQLQGTTSNRLGLGARLRVRVRAAAGPRDFFRTVSSGGSFGGSPLTAHVGLGQALAIDEVEVRWPTSRTVQSFRDLERDQSYRIREGEPKLVAMPRKRISFLRQDP